MAVESSELKKLGAHLYSCTQRATKASITYTQKSAHKKRIIFILYKACFVSFHKENLCNFFTWSKKINPLMPGGNKSSCVLKQTFAL